MPRPTMREDAAVAKRDSAVYRAGTWTTTGTTPAAIWTPASGMFLRIYRIHLQAYVTTVLAGATLGDYIYVYDNAYANSIGEFRAQNMGSATATRAAQLGQIAGATDAATVHYGYCDIDFGIGGIRLAAANNILRAGTSLTIGSGVITFQGFVIGVEEPSPTAPF